MILNNRWYSPEGYILELNSGVHFIYGKFHLPKDFYYKDCDFCGIVSGDEKNYEIAFVINWKTKSSISYTAFKGTIDHEGNLLLNWLLSSQNLNSNKRKNVPGSSILRRSISALKPCQKTSPSLPYPLELQSTPPSSELFLLSNQHYL